LLDQFYNSVKTFNNLGGGGVSMKDFIAQQKCLVEELNEIEEGITNNDVVEILDGVIDVIFVALGHLQKLEQLGCDVQGAVAKVCYDNLKKFPLKVEDAQKSVIKFNADNINVSYSYNDQYNRYVLKDTNGKIRKPYNFVSTDLSEYVPKELQQKGIV